MDNDYKAGQEAFYHEEGCVYKVQVLKSDCDEKKERYELKILEVIQENPMLVSAEVGEEFSCDKQKGVACGGLWHLLNH